MYQILVCSDKIDGLSDLVSALTVEGHHVEKARTNEEAFATIRHKEIHLAVLDWSPAEDFGLSAIRTIREMSNVPVLLLSACEDDRKKIIGLNAGADDIIQKPYNIDEVIARVNSLLRRYMHLGCRNVQNKELRVGELVLNDQTKVVTVQGAPVSLTPLEYDILALLMKSPGRVFTSKEIYRIVWNAPPMGAENAVAVHIRHIREKIEANPAQPCYLRVVWGKGYKVYLEE